MVLVETTTNVKDTNFNVYHSVGSNLESCR